MTEPGVPGWVQRQVDLARATIANSPPPTPDPDWPYSLDTPLGWAVAGLAVGAAQGRENCAVLFAELERLRAIERAPWLLALVRQAGLAAEELACNGDHELHEGCDKHAWEALVDAVPARVRNAADKEAAR